MSAMEHPRSLSAGLTDHELDALRLLAAGHTTKTIAVRLGRSETAINECLRAARRKTGIGSSRELARLLDAQKIWDNKIDLPPQIPSGNSALQPATVGRKRRKAMIAMLVAMPVIAAGLIVGVAPSMQQTAITQTAITQVADDGTSRQLPLVGSWSLDVSRIPETERPQRVTMTFRVSKDRKWTTLVEIVAADGSSRHAESTAAVDGVPVPVAGNMDFIDTVALRQPAPGTLVMTLGKNGAPMSTRVYTVAKNLKSMTETIIWAGSDVPKLETTYFSRID